MDTIKPSIIIVTILVTSILSLDSTPTSGGSTRLCVTKEWEGGQAMMTGMAHNGKRSVTKSMLNVQYSAIQKKIRTFDYMSPKGTTMLFDFPAGALYTVTYDRYFTNPQCTTAPLKGPFVEQCLPDNHTITMDSNTMFGAGVYVSFGWEAQGTLGDLTYHVTMSDDNLPMFEEIYGTKDGIPFFQNVFFYNTTRTTFLPTSFSVPDSCK